MVSPRVFHFGKPSRCRLPQSRMRRARPAHGLMPPTPAQPGGKRTGQRMTHLHHRRRRVRESLRRAFVRHSVLRPAGRNGDHPQQAQGHLCLSDLRGPRQRQAGLKLHCGEPDCDMEAMLPLGDDSAVVENKAKAMPISQAWDRAVAAAAPSSLPALKRATAHQMRKAVARRKPTVTAPG